MTTIGGDPFDPVVPLAGLDVFFRRHNDRARTTNRKGVFGRQIVIDKFIPEMPRVDDGALVKASIEFDFGPIFGRRRITHLLVSHQR